MMCIKRVFIVTTKLLYMASLITIVHIILTTEINREESARRFSILKRTASDNLAKSSKISLKRPYIHEDNETSLKAAEWNSILRAHYNWKYKINKLSDSWRAEIHQSGLTANFDDRGVNVSNRMEKWKWGLELAAYGAGSRLVSVSKITPKIEVDNRYIKYYWNDVITEWYYNANEGLEHGYTINNRPFNSEKNRPLEVRLLARGDLRKVTINDKSNSVDFGNNSNESIIKYDNLKVYDANNRMLDAKFEPSNSSELIIVINDKDALYPINIDPVIKQVAYLKGSNTEENDLFGYSVSVSGNTAVVGAIGESSNASLVDGNQFDNSAGLSGAAYVFVNNGIEWIQQAYLKPSNTDSGDLFGYSVSISGDTIVVGAIGESSSSKSVGGNELTNNAADSGAAYVFVREGEVWKQQSYLKASNAGINDFFGYSVAIDNNTIVVGAIGESSNAKGINGNGLNDLERSSGAAYVFVRNSSTWNEQAYIKASNTQRGDLFGGSVAISGDTAVVGAIGESGSGINNNQADNSTLEAGAAYVFQRTDQSWVQQAYLKSQNASPKDWFGCSVSISGNTLVVGALGESSGSREINGNELDNDSKDSGAAYVFVRTINTWNQQAYLKSINSEPNDWFGYSVAISGDTIIVGAIGESSNSIGVNGNTSDNSSSDAGAVYRYIRNGSTWIYKDYIKAYNADENDNFGYSVAISGKIVIIGSVGESDSGRDSSGNQTNNNSPQSGAAYVFIIPDPVVQSQSETGSILVYNLYVSTIRSAQNNTKISLTNVNEYLNTYVRLFFIDGLDNSIVQTDILVNKNKTISLEAYDFDPLVQGYLIAVAINEDGYPIVRNDLIGSCMVKLDSRHWTALSAVTIIGKEGIGDINSDSSTVTIEFNGIAYSELPRVLAISNIFSVTSGVTMLAVNRLSGDLFGGTQQIGYVDGILYDDAENSLLMSLEAPNRQLVVTLGDNYPRLTGSKFSRFIRSNNSGWMKIWGRLDQGITGAVIVASGSQGFAGGHNLHVISTTNTAKLTIPATPVSIQ